MARIRGRRRRGRRVGGRRERGVRMDSIFEEILGGRRADTPGVMNALIAVEQMRAWGVEVTTGVARRCLLAQMARAGERERWMAEHAAEVRAQRHPPIVYYMRLGALVKIGFTTNLTLRVAAIGAEEVLATEPGGREREHRRHRQFAALRVHGEWFHLAAPLTHHINALARQGAGQ
jgi:hypothetical protein